MKYFKQEQKEKILLSEYDKSPREIKYLIELLGDVSMEEDMIKLFCSEFHCYGGRYDVRTEPDTIKDMYDITIRFPKLTKDAIEDIWFRYIRDLFQEYDLLTTLEKYIQIFGENDDAFESFIYYSEQKADEYQETFESDIKQVEELKDEYSERFISHIQYLIRGSHYKYDDIKKYLPDSELIKKDEQHIYDLSSKTRIFFGCCEPVSYTLFDLLVKRHSLEKIEEDLKYYVSTGTQEKATFTKTEFLESIKKTKIKQKK